MVGDNSLRGARRRPNHPPRGSSPPRPRAPEAEPRSLQGKEPSRILCDTSKAPNPEYACQAGQIHVRSRTLMNSSG